MAASLTAMTLDFAPPAKRFSAEERVALVLALAAHVGVAALLVMRPAAPPPAPPRRMEVTLAASPTDAVRRALERSGPEDRVVVCGSLYVVADAREALLTR